jgi:electron transport complex protein RnfE
VNDMNLPGAGGRFIRGILDDNPTFRQMLGMCPTLAVTAGVATALTMSGAVIFVLVCSNVTVSLLRRRIEPHLRILVYTLLIAAFVTIADLALKAHLFRLSLALGPYVPLIIVNCIIIGRAELVASRQGIWPSFCDAVGQGLGFTLALTALSSIREILGAGTWLGLRVLPETFPVWGIMLLPPGAFISLGVLIAGVTWLSHPGAARRPDRPTEAQPATETA